MNYTSELFRSLKAFDDLRRERREQFLNFKKANQKYEGSEGYKDAIDEAARKRKASDDAARKEALEKVNASLRKMAENAEKTAMEPPTDEQMRIIDALRARKHVTQEEITKAAACMGGNILLLRLLNDLERERFPDAPKDHTEEATDNMGGEALKRTIKSIADRATEILNSPVNSFVLDAARVHRIKFGGTEPDEDSLPQREPLGSERDFLLDFVPEENLEEFTATVNR